MQHLVRSLRKKGQGHGLGQTVQLQPGFQQQGFEAPGHLVASSSAQQAWDAPPGRRSRLLRGLHVLHKGEPVPVLLPHLCTEAPAAVELGQAGASAQGGRQLLEVLLGPSWRRALSRSMS